MEQLVTGVTEHAGVARSLEKREFRPFLGIFHFGYLAVPGHDGVIRLQIRAKFGHLKAECLGLEARKGILTWSNFKNIQIFPVGIRRHMRETWLKCGA